VVRGRGLFVTLEGGEGAGKSIQAAALGERLRGALLVREPGGTELGERLRDVLLSGGDIEPLTETLLFFAARAQLVSEVIVPALGRGDIVICDRFTDSTRAYQGFGRGVPAGFIEELSEMLPGGIEPDLKVLLDVPVSAGLGRASGGARDRFEAEDIDFHERVRNGFLQLAAAEPNRWLILDGTDDVHTITKQIMDRVMLALESKA
jgi:dTMP kinase